MGVWSYLFGKRHSEDIFLRGNGYYDFEVVGESYRQDTLERICGGRTEDGANYECVARLVPEPRNRHDRNAVRVEVDGQHVAYLSRDIAAKYKGQLNRLGLSGRAARCNARIVGGWDRGSDDRGHFGVDLDIEWPISV